MIHLRFLAGLMLCVLGRQAVAKPWNGIEPTVSRREDIVKQFGEPTKVTRMGSTDVLTYSLDKAIKGTVQAQFRVDLSTGTVARIDVFPAMDLERDAIEKKYGAECAEGEREGCYLRRTQDNNKPPYFLYAKLGVAIFFKGDGKTVQSFAFLPSKK